MIRRSILASLLSAVTLMAALFSFSEDKTSNSDELKKNAPKIFLDCYRCDQEYIKTEITFVNFVRERQESDIHILVTTQRTGAGGTEYTMAFIGRKDYADIQQTLRFFSKQTDTEDDVRRGLAKVLKMGLVPYMTKTPLSDSISVVFEEKVSPTAVEDKWNFWVFSVSLNSSLSGEKLRNSLSIRGNISANRVTPALKLRMGVSGNFDDSNFRVEGETISSYSERKSFSGLFVKSISDHFSVGTWISAYSSTYNNIDFSLTPVPAVEYNFFPYSQSTRRELCLLYRVGYNFVNYREETIYEKVKEKLLSQALTVSFELQEPWGTADISLEASHYFPGFSKNRLQLHGGLYFRLYKGLSLGVNGGFSAIHDQLSLPRREASETEILLRRKELETNYSYYGSIGFSYTFGSVYSNVVNPRFGGR